MPNFQHKNLYTYSYQILSNLLNEEDGFQFVVEPAMIDQAGSLAQGVLTEFLKEISLRVLTKKNQKNIIIEQMMIYFLQAVQIDDRLIIKPRIITESRRSSTLDFEVFLEDQIVAKAVVTTKIN